MFFVLFIGCWRSFKGAIVLRIAVSGCDKGLTSCFKGLESEDGALLGQRAKMATLRVHGPILGPNAGIELRIWRAKRRFM